MTSGCRTRHDFRGAVGAVGDTLYSIARIAGGVVTPAVWTRTGLPAARRDRWSWRGSTGRGFSPCRPRFGPKDLGVRRPGSALDPPRGSGWRGLALGRVLPHGPANPRPQERPAGARLFHFAHTDHWTYRSGILPIDRHARLGPRLCGLCPAVRLVFFLTTTACRRERAGGVERERLAMAGYRDGAAHGAMDDHDPAHRWRRTSRVTISGYLDR